MTKRTYQKGGKVESLVELAVMIVCDRPIYCRHKFYDVGWYQNWSFAQAKQQIKFGSIYRAEKIQPKEEAP